MVEVRRTGAQIAAEIEVETLGDPLAPASIKKRTTERRVAAEWRDSYPAVPAAKCLSGADIFYKLLQVVGDHYRLQCKNIA